MSVFFSAEGDVNHSPTVIAIGLASLAMSVNSQYGFLNYKSGDVVPWVFPVAGTFAALALPAAQLAQSSVSDFLSAAQTLLETDSSLDAVRSYLSDQATQYRRDLNSARCVVLYSFVSFLTATVGMLVGPTNMGFGNRLAVKDLIACLSVASMVAAVVWLIPVVNSAFGFAAAKTLLEVLAAQKPAPPKSSAELGVDKTKVPEANSPVVRAGEHAAEAVKAASGTLKPAP